MIKFIFSPPSQDLELGQGSDDKLLIEDAVEGPSVDEFRQIKNQMYRTNRNCSTLLAHLLTLEQILNQ